MAIDQYTQGAVDALDALAGAFQDLAAEGKKQRMAFDDIVAAIAAARNTVLNPPPQKVADLARQSARNVGRAAP